MNRNGSFYTYILKCADSSYYIGSTDNPDQRLSTHNAGRGSKWTALRVPVELVYCEMHETLEQAIQRERQIKKWSRAKKEALITEDGEKLKKLSKKRQK